MNVCKSFFVLMLLFSSFSMKAQDTIPQRDSARIADTLEIDSIGNIPFRKMDTVAAAPVVDTAARRPKHSPRKAAIRSAIIPGWGQVYNKKYWKVPIVYAAIGVPVGTFIYNKNWYTKTRDAARMIASSDTANYKQRVDPKLWIFFSTDNAIGSLLNYRNEFRRNMDYSVLITLLMWGLNVIDATVDAHLKEFDVSEDLTLRIKPTIFNYNMNPGVSFVFTIGKHGSKNPPKLY